VYWSHHTRIRLALAAAFVLATFTGTSAQTYQGSLRGAVRDSQGVIPGAEVTLINQDTNAERSAMTNEVGEYAFASLLPGTYTVRVALPGFKTEERTGVRIGTQQAAVLDFMLDVGAISEQITVTGEAPLIDRATASVATTSTAAQLTAIPIFGRNTFYTAIATPSVIQSGDPQFVRYQDQSGSSLLSLGGGPRRGNSYMIEGVSITDFINRASWVPSTEAVEDMRVRLKTYDAEMGRAAGGVFNVTAKSGSNAWHGSALFMNKPGWGPGSCSSPSVPAFRIRRSTTTRGPGRSAARSGPTGPSSGSARTTTSRRARATTCSRSRRCGSATATSRSRRSPSTTR
jgi:hypothetical protein